MTSIRTESEGHFSVLLHEAVDALNVRSSGTYLDGTFGRGGHSKEILKKLGKGGRLIAVDKDADAVLSANSLPAENFHIVHGSFADITRILSGYQIAEIDGVLLDLGVSSPQLNDASRGFSFMSDGPLDMRMDVTQGMSAANWLNGASTDEITQVLKDYGEERFAKNIARKIVKERQTCELVSTRQLVDIVTDAIPKRYQVLKNPATRTFQAIRIFINRELEDLEQFLQDVISRLSVGGRIVVISFHSLEDRIVKRFFKKICSIDVPDRLPVRASELPKSMYRQVGRAVRASSSEISRNVRSRSAIMRVAERVTA
ncbi:MAG: 16S rRNA (cytosine(1402)-N(4))-methyltransferase RsmH [Betaproteobacteria bacterium]